MTQENAHPHWDTSGASTSCLNGIVENWTELRAASGRAGAEFTSETDAEVVAHLIASHLDGDLVEAVRLAYNERALRVRRHVRRPSGCSSAPARSARWWSGLARASFIASAIPAFMAETRRVQLVHDGEIVAITPEGARFSRRTGRDRARDRRRRLGRRGGREGRLRDLHAEGDPRAGRGRGGDVAGRLGEAGVDLGDRDQDEFLRSVRRIVIVACGTSYHAGLVGRYAIEWWGACPWRWTSPPSSATATRCSTSATW